MEIGLYTVCIINVSYNADQQYWYTLTQSLSLKLKYVIALFIVQIESIIIFL